MTELVVLVDEHGAPIGEAPKATVHSAQTPRHLGFSCHIVDRQGRVLMTRRALSKQTWPGVWTNAFCGHPAPGESFEDAVRRRAQFELGLDVEDITCVLPNFGYRAVDASGIVEYEHCPVFVAKTASPVLPNDTEVAELAWSRPGQLALAIESAPWAFSPWLVEHFDQLAHVLNPPHRIATEP